MMSNVDQLLVRGISTLKRKLELSMDRYFLAEHVFTIYPSTFKLKFVLLNNICICDRYEKIKVTL